ncbi:hypothetical protein [Hydrogenophaga sp. RWCD_12]|uniref:hypothetical protein n=1 Tax=Hydrogenophaga sp. RWCD_12 TaxID=3391190 RepID=UPI003984EFD5
MSTSKMDARWLFAGVLCLGLLGGCGGGSEKEQDSTPTAPSPDAPVDLSGAWVSSGDLIIGALQLQQDGELVTGAVENEYGSQPLEGTVFGYDLAFSFAQVRNSCEVKVNCFVTLFDEQMRGSCRLATQCPGLPASTRNGRITLTRE